MTSGSESIARKVWHIAYEGGVYVRPSYIVLYAHEGVLLEQRFVGQEAYLRQGYQQDTIDTWLFLDGSQLIVECDRCSVMKQYEPEEILDGVEMIDYKFGGK